MDGALNLIYPKHCLICNRILEYRSREWLCPDCLKNYPNLTDECCEKCGKPLDTESKFYCYDCHRNRHYFTMGKAMWIYDGMIKERIKDFKYSNKAFYGEIFGSLLAHYYMTELLWQVDYLVPVPLHRRKRYERGFNQVDLMCKAFVKETDIEYLKDLIIRNKYTVPQKSLSDTGRLENIENAFSCRENKQKYDIINKKILVIDDIYTTGSTIDGVAKVLKGLGASDIYFLTIAIGRGFS